MSRFVFRARDGPIRHVPRDAPNKFRFRGQPKPAEPADAGDLLFLVGMVALAIALLGLMLTGGLA